VCNSPHPTGWCIYRICTELWEAIGDYLPLLKRVLWKPGKLSNKRKEGIKIQKRIVHPLPVIRRVKKKSKAFRIRTLRTYKFTLIPKGEFKINAPGGSSPNPHLSYHTVNFNYRYLVLIGWHCYTWKTFSAVRRETMVSISSVQPSCSPANRQQVNLNRSGLNY
jgi:hypothetical protein